MCCNYLYPVNVSYMPTIILLTLCNTIIPYTTVSNAVNSTIIIVSLAVIGFFTLILNVKPH